MLESYPSQSLDHLDPLQATSICFWRRWPQATYKTQRLRRLRLEESSWSIAFFCGDVEGNTTIKTCRMRSKIVVFWFVLQGPSAYSLLSSHYDDSRLKGSIESCHNPSFWYGPNNHRAVLEYNFPSQRNDVLRFQLYGLYSLTPPLNLKGFAIKPFQ